jgi:hypothetical protein
MGISIWCRWLRRRNVKSAQSHRSPSSRRVQPSLECLESRDLLNATAAAPLYVLYQPQAGVAPMSSSGPSGMAPSQIEQAYGFNQISFTNNGTPVSANGAGQTIAIVDAYNDPTIASDLQGFDKQFGLANPNLTVLNQNGGTTLPGVDSSGGWELEESLDVEWAHAVAPGANIVLVEANSSNYSDLLTAVQTAANLSGVAAVSMSWGGGEFGGESSYDSYFTTPSGHSGVTFIASSGDSGAPPSYPAVSPNVLAVGGTTLTLNSSGNYQSESAWGGSGGGISADETQPSYQNGVVSAFSTTQRTNPDVAYDADPSTGFAVYDSYNYGTSAPWIQVGGTSDAAPQWAGLVAIADQGRNLAGLSNLDGPSQLLPDLYQMPSTDFHDVTSGSSNGSPSYPAGPGYDLATGLGTPVANQIVAYLTVPAPTGLTATATSSSQINLSWSADSGASNGYAIDRSANGTSGWTQIGTTLAGVTTYSDTGLNSGTTYYYKISAVNNNGDSPFCNVVNATTQGNSTPQFSDAGFETPNVGTNSFGAFAYNPTGSSWTFSTSSGVAGNGSGFTSGNPNAPQGTQVAFLQMNGTMSQAVNFSAGTYTISFDAAQRGNNGVSTQEFEVEVDGTVVGTFTPGSTNYASYTTSAFTVTAGSHTVEFVGLDPNGGDNTAFLDEASIATALPPSSPPSPPPSPPPSSGSQFSDGGFETPNVGTGTFSSFAYNPTGSPWTFSTSSGVAGNGSGFTSGNPNAPQGTQVAFLQMNGTMSQAVNFSAGTYTISFDAAQRGNNGVSTQEFEVEVDGTVVGTFTPGSTNYASYTTSAFTVTVGSHTVEFVGLDPNGGDNTAFLDEASIATAPAVVPNISNPGVAAPPVAGVGPAASSVSIGSASAKPPLATILSSTADPIAADLLFVRAELNSLLQDLSTLTPSHWLAQIESAWQRQMGIDLQAMRFGGEWIDQILSARKAE